MRPTIDGDAGYISCRIKPTFTEQSAKLIPNFALESLERRCKRFGNIGIAATDAAANAMTESAIEEAHRAVNELT